MAIVFGDINYGTPIAHAANVNLEHDRLCHFTKSMPPASNLQCRECSNCIECDRTVQGDERSKYVENVNGANMKKSSKGGRRMGNSCNRKSPTTAHGKTIVTGRTELAEKLKIALCRDTVVILSPSISYGSFMKHPCERTDERGP